ncbi:hypothetical protein [Bacillus cereus]|uniref:hypothetical protein n=1 Tax=Bacillus cereus group TaxID=86661 RepID=UPI001F582346|nr:hypothetical protein [Bacillus cereus]MDC7777932.1 hypothetical protein [Bacillus cereus]
MKIKLENLEELTQEEILEVDGGNWVKNLADFTAGYYKGWSNYYNDGPAPWE